MALFKKKNTELSVLQCTTAYPTLPEQWGLNIIKDLKHRYNIPTGLSDHSGDITACLAAAALGAEIFEFHVVFDKRMFGPDAKASIEIDEVKRLVEGIKQIKSSLENNQGKNDRTKNMDGFENDVWQIALHKQRLTSKPYYFF